MATEGSDSMNPITQLTTSTTATASSKRKQDAKICCTVCNKTRCLAKYRSHLMNHVHSGDLAADRVNQMLFECRTTRSDIKEHNLGKHRIGYTCKFKNDSTVCNKVVQDIRRHLVITHKLDSCCSKFEDLIRLSSSHKCHVGIRSGSLSDESTTWPTAQNAMNDAQPGFQAEVAKVANYEFESESSSDSFSEDENSWDEELSAEVPVFISQKAAAKRKQMPGTPHMPGSDMKEKLLREFNAFLLTKGGGGRQNRPVEGDMSSFRRLLVGLGWENLWNASKLNQYITDESKGTLSSSTMYGRLRVYERFVDFLQIEHTDLLPEQDILIKMEKIIKNLKEALSKDRYSRNVQTMTDSRKRLNHSINVCKEWQDKRSQVTELKGMFATISSNKELFTESGFIKMRNYLIVEIILANAQRSGIITGLLIKEVIEAKSKKNALNNHYIYVQNHKTGFKQPAIIYLESDIYLYLLVFVQELLPLLPSISVVRCADNCHVFQTWRGKTLASSNVSYCLRAGLALYGIYDPKAQPTHFRKAAATLMSMHNPQMQEPLSQFMCHNRSTAERYYRHHMSHEYMSQVFVELARCQKLAGERMEPTDGNSQCTTGGLLLEQNTIVDPILPGGSECYSMEYEESCLPTCQRAKEGTLEAESSNVNIESFTGLEITIDEASAQIYPKTTTTEIEHRRLDQAVVNNKYSALRNGKSIFTCQYDEDIFFNTFEKLIDRSMKSGRVTLAEIVSLAVSTVEFKPLWERLISEMGIESAKKKVSDKIRTFARNNKAQFSN